MSTKRTSASSQHAPSQTSPSSKHPPGLVPSPIANIDPTALAHHLTLLEASLYMRVKRSQCLEWHQAGKMLAQQAKGGEHSGVDAETAVAGSNTDVNDLREFCATNDRLAGWVKWSVLSLKTATSRAEAIGTWVRVAEKCRQLDNTSSLCAIVAGLTSSDITRLNVTASLVATNRSQRLTDLQRITSPAGSFAALKVLYAGADGPGVPFVGMYLTGLVHASDQFKDMVSVAPPVALRTSQDGKDAPSEPATPTQTVSGPTRMLLNFTKRHKQADIIGSMLKFQQWPYTVVPTITEPTGSTARQMSSSPPSTQTISTAPSTNTTTFGLYPYIPSTSAPTALYASAAGVAWVEEQLARAARITLGSDWTYERSMRLYEDEAGWSTVRDIMNEVGF
ncbi:hypothetical protein FRC07_003644 [Ceratobasidium sp. 392]|nr:hypothetical protein FRC07_003644 [Ceratobasidium sp. 392]